MNKKRRYIDAFESGYIVYQIDTDNDIIMEQIPIVTVDNTIPKETTDNENENENNSDNENEREARFEEINENDNDSDNENNNENEREARFEETNENDSNSDTEMITA